MVSIAKPWMWAAFLIFVVLMLILDLFVLGGRKSHKVTIKEAATWSITWVSLALMFNALLWWYLKQTTGIEIANQKAIEFLTGYIIEKSLSVDNIFVFLMIFAAFKVPAEHQRRVLLYGVLGAIILRASMILAGAWLVQEFHWILYVFGGFLLITGLRMILVAEKTPDLENNLALRIARKHLRISKDYHGNKFVIRNDGVYYFTPLFLVLLLIEFSDVIFAVDSIPAIFAITLDPFIVFTSNIFAILGLRALYFLLLDIADRFHLLKYGLALVLMFIGFKMLIAYWIKIPTITSLLVIMLTLLTSIIASMMVKENQD
ncbi:MAG: TerC family protein [Methylophilaceae bacterium]